MSSIPRYQILIIEDDEQLRDSLSATFELDGYIVRGVPNLRIAELELSGRPYDLVITDLFLYETDNETITDVLRRNSQNIPVLVVAAYPEFEITTLAHKIFNGRFFDIPQDLQRLLESIYDLLPNSDNHITDNHRLKG